MSAPSENDGVLVTVALSFLMVACSVGINQAATTLDQYKAALADMLHDHIDPALRVIERRRAEVESAAASRRLACHQRFQCNPRIHERHDRPVRSGNDHQQPPHQHEHQRLVAGR